MEKASHVQPPSLQSPKTHFDRTRAPIKKGSTQVPALLVTTTLEVGLNMGLATKEINPRIVNGWRNGEEEMSKCWRQALHFVEGAPRLSFAVGFGSS
jgi:hypothetical protein